MMFKKAVKIGAILLLCSPFVYAIEGSVQKIEGPLAAYQRQDSFSLLALNENIISKDTIFTGYQTKTDLLFPIAQEKDIFVTVYPESIFSVDESYFKKEEKPLYLRLFFGLVKAVVPKNTPELKMNIETPNAVIGVRGTKYCAEAVSKIESMLTSIIYNFFAEEMPKKVEEDYLESSSLIAVKDGKVAVSSKNGEEEETLVSENHIAIIGKNGAVISIKVTEEKMNAFFNHLESQGLNITYKINKPGRFLSALGDITNLNTLVDKALVIKILYLDSGIDSGTRAPASPDISSFVNQMEDTLTKSRLPDTYPSDRTQQIQNQVDQDRINKERPAAPPPLF